MKLIRVGGELEVLGRNEAVRVLLRKHRQITIAQSVCEETEIQASLRRAKEYVRGKLAKYGVPLEG